MRDPEIILISLISFFAALITALLFSALFRRFKVPWAVALILGGIVMGPHGLGIFSLNEIVMFLAEVGVIFLMFIAGMETRVSAIKSVWKESAIIGFVSGLVPGVVGITISLIFNYSLTTSLLIGIIFVSSSFAVVIPTLEAKGIIHTRIGRVIVASTMLQDIASLIILVLLLRIVSPVVFLPFPVLVIVLLLAVSAGLIVKNYIPLFRQWLAKMRAQSDYPYSLFEQELTLVIAVLIGVAILFELLKLETIVGAFFAGVILAEITRSKILQAKIHILGYGIFIPIFFVTVGAWTDIRILTEEALSVLPLVLSILLGSSVSKFASGWISAKWLGFTNYDSTLVGITSIPQLITTLAVVLVGQRLGLLDPELVTAIIILSITTVIVSPLITSRVLSRKPA